MESIEKPRSCVALRSTHLVKDTTVVRRYISRVEKQAFLHWEFRVRLCGRINIGGYSRRLKLLTGVETSTRPVNKSGREGKRQTRTRRGIKAALNTATLRRSTAMTGNGIDWRNALLCSCPLKAEEPRRPQRTGHPPSAEKKVIENFFFLLSATV